MDVKLTIYDDKRQYFSQIVRLPCVVGRGKQCNIAIVHPLISRRHCEIYEDAGGVKARDLGSLNGTFYRGERIGRGIAIPFGDGFSIGSLNFLIENPEPETTKLFASSRDADSGFDAFDGEELESGKAAALRFNDVLLSSQANQAAEEEEILDLADFLEDDE